MNVAAAIMFTDFMILECRSKKVVIYRKMTRDNGIVYESGIYSAVLFMVWYECEINKLESQEKGCKKRIMKIIAIAAVTAGGKTTIVNEIKKQIDNVKVLHFDDYSFEG